MSFIGYRVSFIGRKHATAVASINDTRCTLRIGECISKTLPPEGDDAIATRSSLRSTLNPLPKYFEQRQAARSVHRNKRESKCEAATPPRHRTRYARRCLLTAPLLHTAAAFRHTLSTAAAVVRYLPCSKCLGCAFALRSPLRTRQEIHRLLPMVRCTRIKRLRQSGFVANGTRRLTFFASPSTADNGTAVRAFAGRVRNRRLCQLPDLYASATPHSLRSYGVCSVARSWRRCRFATNSFRQAAPTPTCAPTAYVLPSASSVLRTSIADNNTSIGCIDLTFLVLRLNARNWRCHD